ncbi:MAG: substrate-binding domain-containing protein [Actinobacteria bacterium]|nr:substrate-binding domain-containing protein [Actinomycetota bacterium]MSX38130.1 substrate-binding domain-containing protein [Actinomycetota bacterium]
MNMRHKSLKFTVLAGAVAMTAMLAACSSSSTPAETSAPAESSAAGGTIDVGSGKITPKNIDKIAYMVQAGKTFSYTSAQALGAADAAKELGVTVDVYYSNLDPAAELSNFNQIFTTDKYGGLLIQSVNQQLCKTIGDGAVENSMLVYVVGNPLCDQATAVGEALWSPGTIGYMGGQNGVDGISGLLNDAAKVLTGPQNVMLAMGIKGHPSTVAWEAAFAEFQKTHSDWTLANETFTDFTTPGAFKAVQDSLQGNPGVTAIFSLYVDVTAGVVKAVEAQSLGGSVKVFENGGGSKVSVELLTSGKEAGSLPVYPYSLGYEGVKVMVAALKGTQPPKFTPFDGNPDGATQGTITKDTVAAFKPQW